MKRSQKHQGRRRVSLLLFTVLAAAFVLFSLSQLLGQEVFQWIMNQKEYKTMMAETAALFAAFCVCFFFPKQWQKILSASLVLSIFLWAHMAFAAVAVSGIYLSYVLLLGRFLRKGLWNLRASDGLPADFLTGMSFLLVVYCLMSAIGVGSIPCLIGFVFVSAAYLVFRAKVWLDKEESSPSIPHQGEGKGVYAFFLAFILTMICIQAGRLNIAVDYDSLWYGVRSPYILDNGHGIYENLGTIGIVYTYSKGLEVLTLPLALLPSYGFLTAVNLWLSAGVIYMGYKIGRFFLNRQQAVFLAVLITANPGIMNMAVTAKSDMITLLVQLIMVYYLLLYVQKGTKAWRCLAYAFSAFFLSWTLKPTAMVFSTAVFGMALLFFVGKGLVPRLGAEIRNRGSLGVLTFSLCALMGIWARTMIITGLPVTSVFSALLVKLGLELKYPFQANSIPNSVNGLSHWEKACQFGKRLFEFLFRPVGADMEHVILAWGGFVLVFLFLLWITSCFSGKNVDREGKWTKRRGQESENGGNQLSLFLNVIYLPFLLVNLISLSMLTQVDGNYFMLFYALTTVWVMKRAAIVPDQAVWRAAAGASVWVLLFSVFVTAMTNWNWTLGFSPVSMNHRGYYNHYEEARETMEQKGNKEIWDLLAENPRTRAIAIGTHPEVLRFPCSIQSYDDITGVWGNVALVKTMDSFLEFLSYAETDYIYAEAGYMGEGERAYELVKDLIRAGKLRTVSLEQGNFLASVDVNGKSSVQADMALTEFEECYIKKGTN